MIVYVCVDNNLGMMFNNRRQSRDSAVITNFLQDINDNNAFADPYSANLLSGYSQIHFDESFLSIAEANDYCFVEKNALYPYIDKIERLVLYCWNRDYPFDQSLDLDLAKWRLTGSSELVGTSHTITKFVYER